MNFEAIGLSQNDVSIVTSRLRSELVNLGKYRVVEREKMDEILKEQGFQLSGCTTNECVVEAGKLLGVRYILSGTIGILGTTYTLDTRMIDVETGELLKPVKRNYEGKIEGLLDILPGLAQEISGVYASTQLGQSAEFQYEKTQDIVFELNVANAIPVIDNRRTGKPQSSKHITIPFSEGTHNIRFLADGYRSSDVRTFYVRIGEPQTIGIELTRDESIEQQEIKAIPFASVNFFSSIPSVDVIIDGVFVGKTGPSGISQLLSASINGEEHEVVYKKPKYLPKFLKIKVYTNKTNADVNTTPTPNFGTLIINCKQGKANIYINGKLNYKKATREGQKFSEVVTGKYKVRLEKERYLPSKEKEVFVPVGKEAKLDFDLKPAWGDATLTSQPSGAKVYLDGNLIGKTPLELKGETNGLLAGSYNFKFDLESAIYPPVEKMVVIKSGEEKNENTNFNDISGTFIIKTKPSPLKVLINGKYDAGLSRGRPVKYPEGSYQIDILNTGPHENSYYPIKKNIVLTKGKQLIIKEDFKVKKGLLFLHSNVPGTQFIVKDLLENKEILKSDKIENKPVLTGKYEIVANAQAKGYILMKKQVKITEGFRDVIRFEFNEKDKKAYIAERKRKIEKQKKLALSQYINGLPDKYPNVFINPDKHFYNKYKKQYEYIDHGALTFLNALGLQVFLTPDFLHLITGDVYIPAYHSWWKYAKKSEKIYWGIALTLETLHGWALVISAIDLGVNKQKFVKSPFFITYLSGILMGGIFDLIEYNEYKDVHKAINDYEEYKRGHLGIIHKMVNGKTYLSYNMYLKVVSLNYSISL